MKRKKILLIAAFIIILCSVEFVIASYYSRRANARISEAESKEQFITNAETEGESTESDTEAESTETEIETEEQTQGTIQIKEVATKHIQVEVPKVRASYIGPGYSITCWGDSLTEGTGASSSIVVNGIRAATMPSTLANLTNMKVYNMGVYGELSRDIASRQGGLKMYVNNISIPASGSVYFNQILCEDGTPINPWTTYDTDVYGLSACFDECTIAGIKGKLSYDFNREQFVFTRLDTEPLEDKTEASTTANTIASTESSKESSTEISSTASTVSPTESATVVSTPKYSTTSLRITSPTEIITPPSTERKGDILVIEMGNNGGYDYDYNILVDQYNAMIRHNGNNFFIIVGDTDGSEDDRSDWDYTLQQEFGDHFINMRQYLVDAAASGVLEQFGITLNDYDYDQISRGEVPYSLKSDDSHLNSYGYWLEGKAIYDLGLMLGYWQ